MLRSLIGACLLIASTATVPALAAETAAPRYSTAETEIGKLLDDPEAKAVLDKHMPGFSGNPQVEMARGFTLKAVQSFAPDQMPDAVLEKIDADLAKLPAKN